MEETHIGMIAAMNEEIHPFLKRLGKCRQDRLGRFHTYFFKKGDLKIIIVRSGIGMKNAAQAAHELIKTTRPEMIINFGFAGAVTPGLAVGDLVIGGRSLLHHDRLFAEQQGINRILADQTVKLLESQINFQVTDGTIITATKIACKSRIAALLPQGAVNPVLDMETAAIAQATLRENIPLLAIRAISDAADEELDFAISELTDKSRMNVCLPKVILTVAKRPWLIPQLMRLAQCSKIAGKNMAAALSIVMDDLSSNFPKDSSKQQI